MSAPRRRILSWLGALLLFLPALPPLVYGVAFLSWDALSARSREWLATSIRLPVEALAPLAHLLSVIFLYAGLGIASGAAAMYLTGRGINVLGRLTSIVEMVIGIVVSEEDVPRRRLAALERDLRQELQQSERRLRSEWRFVVVLIAAVVLGAVAIFVALLAWMR